MKMLRDGGIQKQKAKENKKRLFYPNQMTYNRLLFLTIFCILHCRRRVL